MRFNLTKFPVGDDDANLKDEKGADANFRLCLMKALSADVDGEGQPIKGEDKFKRFDLYMKVKKSNGTVDLTAEEVVLATNAAKAFPVIVAGQCRDFLAHPLPEPPSEPQPG